MRLKIWYILLFLSLLGIASISYGKETAPSKISAESRSETYQAYLENTQKLVKKKFPGFFNNINNEQQLNWIEYVSQQTGKYGYDNINQKQGFVVIACYLGKDFMTDKKIDSKIKRFLKDEQFSKYVRVRNIQRYLKREKHSLTVPSFVD